MDLNDVKVTNIELVKKTNRGESRVWVSDGLTKKSLIVLLRSPGGVPVIGVEENEYLYLSYKIGTIQYEIAIGDKRANNRDLWFSNSYMSPVFLQSVRDNEDYSYDYEKKRMFQHRQGGTLFQEDYLRSFVPEDVYKEMGYVEPY